MANLSDSGNIPSGPIEKQPWKPKNRFLQIILISLLAICVFLLCVYGIMRYFGIVIDGDYIYFGVDYNNLEKKHDYFRYEIWIPDGDQATKLNTITTLEINGEPWNPNAFPDPWDNIRLLHTEIENGSHKCFRVLSGWTEEPITVEIFVYQFNGETGETGALILREKLRISPSFYKYQIELLDSYHNENVDWDSF